MPGGKYSVGALAPRLLVVDDDLLFVKTLRRVLRLYTGHIDGVADLDGMLHAIDNAARPYDVIVLDFQLRDTNALALQRALSERGCTIPTVAMSAVATRDVIEQCRVLGALGCYSKFFDDHRRMLELVIDLERCAAVALERRYHARAGSRGFVEDQAAFKAHQNLSRLRQNRLFIMHQLYRLAGIVAHAASEHDIEDSNMRRKLRDLELDSDLFRDTADRYRKPGSG